MSGATAAVMIGSAVAGTVATQAGRGGTSGTMLTGPKGVDLSALDLGKNSLLGS